MDKYLRLEVRDNAFGVNGTFSNVLFYTTKKKGDNCTLKIVFSTSFSDSTYSSDDSTDTLEFDVSSPSCVKRLTS